MYKKDITVFNLHDGVWHPVQLHGVDLIVDRSEVLRQYGESSSDSAKLHVKYKRKADRIICDGKDYKFPEEYAGANDTFTFRSGENFTFFVDGLWSGTESMTDADYKSGFYNYMNKAYKNVYSVSSVAIYYEIPHFEVMAK